MPTDLLQAQREIDLFTSVGAGSFTVTNTDINDDPIWPLSYHRTQGKKFAFKQEATFTARDLYRALPEMLRLSAIRSPATLPDGRRVDAGENLMIRPMGEGVAFVQLDDLSTEQLEKVRDAAFLIHQTSPGNHQAWIAVGGYDGETRILYTRILKALGAGDPSATGSTRLAGSENVKGKYLPEFPMVTIVHGVPGRVMTAERLQSMGLLAEPEPLRPVAADNAIGHRSRSVSGSRPFPSYQKSLAGAPRNSNGDGPDRSKADYWWCYLAAQRNFSVAQIASELGRLSGKANEMNDAKKQTYTYEKARDASMDWEHDKTKHRGRG